MPLNFLTTMVQNQTQREHDIDMYNMQRKDYLKDLEHAEEYNSPAAQKQRLLDAGLNPTLAMQNISTGSVNSPSTPTANAGSMAGVGANLTQNVLSMLGYKQDMAYKAAETRVKNADAKLMEIDAENRLQENLARISKLKGEGRESWKRGDHIDSIETARYQKFMSEIGVDASTAELNWAMHATQMANLKYLPIDKSLNWIQAIGNIVEQYTRSEVNRRQAEYLIEKATAERFGWKGKKFENELNEETKQFLIRARRLQGVPKNPWELGGAGIQEFYDLF